MRGKAQVTDHAGLPGFDERFERPVFAERHIHVLLEISECVELVEIQMVGAQAFECALEFRRRTGPGALQSFAGEKDARAMRLERWTKFDLRIAVLRRDIEIVDAAFDRFGHAPVGHRWLNPGDEYLAEPDHGQRNTV